MGKMILFFVILFTFILFQHQSSLSEGNTIPLSQAEKEWLAQNHKVRIRVGDWPPFMFSENELKGISVDYILKTFQIHGIGYELISDKVVPWKEALALGQVDAYVGNLAVENQ